MGSLLCIKTVGIMIGCVLSLDHSAESPNQHGKSKLGKFAQNSFSQDSSWVKLGEAKTFGALLDRLQQVGAQLVIGLQGKHGYKLLFRPMKTKLYEV